MKKQRGRHTLPPSSMRHIHSVIALALAQHPCVATEITEYDRRSSSGDDTLIVGVACDQARNRLDIGLYTPYELPAGEKIALWNTFDLKKDNPDGESIAKVHHVERRCVLGRHRYRIRLTGEPGNWNMNGECGAITYAKAAVWRDGKMIFNKSISSCEDYRTSYGHLLKLIIFQPANDEPIMRSGKTLSDLYR